MLIDVKASNSSDVGKYLTDRAKEAFFVIEGNASQFDKTAEQVLIDNPRKKISHYSFVLSFKEENLNKEKLIDLYNQFKEKMFQNYNLEELKILSVIHWDDNKPHIHCAVINSSQIDNDRDLRIFRGNVDISRNTAVQETINYENNLSSPFDNYNLLSLTPEQKERDWKCKKRGSKYYKVFDDDFFRNIEYFLKNSNNFNDFEKKIKEKYGKIIFKKYSTLVSEGISLSTILKEDRLVLTEHKKADGNNYVYNSKLFNRSWFNKNIKQIKTALNNGTTLENIKFSEKRKSFKEYKKILQETTQKHAKHLYYKKVGKQWVKDNLNFVLEKDLNRLKNISLDKNFLENTPLDELDMKFERFLSYANSVYIKKFVEEFKRNNFTLEKDFVRLKINEKTTLNLYNENLRTYLNSGNSSNKKNKNRDYEDLLWLLREIKNNKAKTKIRLMIEELIYKQRIKNRKELDKLFTSLGLRVIKIGEDVKKGKYLTLENKFGKVALYNDNLVSLYNKESFNDEDYKKKRDKKIKDKLDEDFFHNLVTEVYLKNVDKYKKMLPRIDNVYQYRLFNSEPLVDTYFKIDKIVDNKALLFLEDDFDSISSVNKDTLRIDKTLDEYRTGMKMADAFALQGYTNLYLNNISNEMRQGTIDRIKEMGYDLSLFDENKHLIYTNKEIKEQVDTNKIKIDIDKTIDKISEELKIDISDELINNKDLNQKFNDMVQKLQQKELKEFKLRNI